jgi:hypothetical protein
MAISSTFKMMENDVVKTIISGTISLLLIAGNAGVSYGANDFSSSVLLLSESEIIKIDDITFSEFIKDLDGGLISKVEFVGINPKFCTAYYKSGKIATVARGFPAFDDPRSPSGPIQVIAKVQHTPGVVCTQDISNELSLASTRKSKANFKPLPMLSHSSYPKEF